MGEKGSVDSVKLQQQGEREKIRWVDVNVVRERVALQAEVVRWCTDNIRKSNEKNIFARQDPFKDRLCELQIQVLERSKVIAQLQARLTELIINCPESAASLQELKRTMNDVNFRRETNKYGYGQDVVRIACNAVDSVKTLVEQVPCDLATAADKEKVYRSLSESAAMRNKRTNSQRGASRSRSLSTNHVSTSTSDSSFHSNEATPSAATLDIRALSNLEMNDSAFELIVLFY